MNNDMQKYLDGHKINYREVNGQYNVDHCLACGDRKWNHFYINDEGLWDCKKCGQSGNFFQFASFFGEGMVTVDPVTLELVTTKFEPAQNKSSKPREYTAPTDHEVSDYEANLWAFDKPLQDYLIKERGLTEQTIKRFHLGSDDGQVTIPIYNQKNEITNIRRRRKLGKTTDTMPKYYTQKGCRTCLFNAKILSKKPKKIFITEGEIDAMQLIQRGLENVISITLGAGSFIQEWADQLKDVSRVFLVYDNDPAGLEGMQKAMDKIGKEKCSMVLLPKEETEKSMDVSDFFKKGKTKDDFLEIISQIEKEYSNELMMHISELSGDLLEIAENGEYKGIETGFENLDKIIGGYRKGRLIILSGLTSAGKCVAWDSEIVNPISGAICTMEEFIKNKKKYILSWEYDRIKKSRVTDWINSGKKEIFKVKTIFGTECKVTAEHPFLCKDMKWRELHELKIGDEIAIPQYLNIWECGAKEMIEEHVKLIAHLLAEGHCVETTNFTYTNFDKDLVEDFKECLNSTECTCTEKVLGEFRIKNKNITLKDIEPKEYSRTSKNGIVSRILPKRTVTQDKPNIRKFWEKYNIKYGTARYKEIPKCIFTLKRELLRRFLSILFSCDGSVFKSKGRIGLSYSTASKCMAKQVRHLLLRFNVNTRLRTKKTNFNTICYELTTEEINIVQSFYKNIGFFCKRKQKILEKIVEKIPRKNKYSASALRFTKIEEIVSKGVQQVYDLSVEGTKNFIVDDMLVHNTTFSVNLALKMIKKDKPVGFISMEMPPIDVAKKLLMIEKELDGICFENPIAKTDPLMKTIVDGVQVMEKYPFYIYRGHGEAKVETVQQASRQSKDIYGVELIVIDHLHYFGHTGGNRSSEISKITRDLKAMAMELDIPVVLLAHLNRGGRSKERTGLYIPSLADLRDSGSIEQDADQVIFVCRDSENEDEDEKKKTLIKVAKNRDGRTGNVSMDFKLPIGLFAETASNYNKTTIPQTTKETLVKQEILFPEQ